MKISIPPKRNSVLPYVLLFLSLLALHFLASCLKHWYENIYPTMHCTFAYVFVLTLSEFYTTLHCGIFIPTCIAGFKYNMKISIPPYIAYLHLYIKISHLMKILSLLKLFNCICICNISHHIKILSHFILWYFYPYFNCSFWPQLLNSNMEISILPYIALFTFVYVNNVM